MNARPRAPLSARSADWSAPPARSADRPAPPARPARRPARPARPAALAALALALAAGACRRPSDEAAGRMHGCTCSYLTDFDDNARIEVTVCVPASKAPLEVAATCASSLSRNYAESCTCGPPRGPCSPSSADACRNQ